MRLLPLWKAGFNARPLSVYRHTEDGAISHGLAATALIDKDGKIDRIWNPPEAVEEIDSVATKRPRFTLGIEGGQGTTTYGRIMSLSSCSMMWQ